MTASEIQSLADWLHAEKVIETHISWVILTRNRAYKIKKPFKATFLDYSTLSKRKKFCRLEYLLNKEYSGDVYKGIVQIRKSQELISLGKNEGKIIDYAVDMKRLDNTREMHLLVQRGKVSQADMRRLALKISTLHKKARKFQRTKSIVSIKAEFNDLAQLINKNPNIQSELKGIEWKKGMAIVNHFLSQHKTLFKDRAKKGFVRDIHGDFHTGNIFLYQKPVVFDRIEFNEEFRIIDILREVAFLCMDLEAFGKKKLSDLFLDSYLASMKLQLSESDKQLLYYYKSYAANVRAKVNLIAYINGEFKNKQTLKKSARYLKQMVRYTQLLK